MVRPTDVWHIHFSQELERRFKEIIAASKKAGFEDVFSHNLQFTYDQELQITKCTFAFYETGRLDDDGQIIVKAGCGVMVEVAFSKGGEGKPHRAQVGDMGYVAYPDNGEPWESLVSKAVERVITVMRWHIRWRE